jgi:hypothetical protein
VLRFVGSEDRLLVLGAAFPQSEWSHFPPVKSTIYTSTRGTGGNMILLKGAPLGVGLSVVGTFVFTIYKLHVLSGEPFFSTGPQTGVDVYTLRSFILHSPAYWLMILLLLAAGYAIIYFWPRHA